MGLRNRVRRTSNEPGDDISTILLSALDCVLNGEKAVYASSDLTTGRRFYELLRKSDARTPEDLRAKIGDKMYRRKLFEPNSLAANAFARSLRHRLGGSTLVIAPAPLTVQGWSQKQYLEFFETLIRTRVQAVYLNDGWQYSNGCTFEFAVAQEAGIATFDADCEPIDRVRGVHLIECAALELEAMGIEPIGLRRHQAMVTATNKPRSPFDKVNSR